MLIVSWVPDCPKSSEPGETTSCAAGGGGVDGGGVDGGGGGEGGGEEGGELTPTVAKTPTVTVPPFDVSAIELR